MTTIRLGQPLRVRLSEMATEYYHSRLVELNQGEYFIDVPLHYMENRIPDVRPNSTVWIEFQGHDGSTCRFQTVVIESVRIPNLAWRIVRPEASKVIREQRREFVRVPADFPVRLEYSGEGIRKYAEVHSRDISGGGIALYLPRPVHLPEGIVVETKFTLPTVDFPIDVKSVVIRVSERDEGGLAIGSLQFMNMKESVRQRVIQYTFWRQRVLLS